MLRLQLQELLYLTPQLAQILLGAAVDEIKGEIVEAGQSGGGNGIETVLAGVDAAETRQVCVAKSLNAER